MKNKKRAPLTHCGLAYAVAQRGMEGERITDGQVDLNLRFVTGTPMIF